MFPTAVIFDFDGVIVNTEPIHYQAFQKILQPIGLGYSWQEYVSVYMGFDDRDAFKTAFKAGDQELSSTKLHELIELKAASFQEIISTGVSPYPGVLELINELKRHDVPIAICSGALLCDIVPILEAFGISTSFEKIVTADDVQQSKPDPASYLMTKQLLYDAHPELGATSKGMFVIEDTPAGIESAKGAELAVIAVTNSYPATQLQRANHRIESLIELLGGNWPI